MSEIFTFWEGRMPAYIKLCLETWRPPYTVLSYENLHRYTDLQIEPLKRFTLPQIADVVRVHVLRDWGGYWLDADTIMVDGLLSTANIMGNTVSRTNTIGYLYTEPHSDFFTEWAEYQDAVISNPRSSSHVWSIMGNDFTDQYLKNHMEITIESVLQHWPEVSMIKKDIPRDQKYSKFYFSSDYHLDDIPSTNMLMLHNSWTPEWYKKLSEKNVLAQKCTLSNILKELLNAL